MSATAPAPRAAIPNIGTAGQGMVSPANAFVDDSGALLPVSFRFLFSMLQRINALDHPPPGQVTEGVSSWNTRTGVVTMLSGDVTTALGFTPYNASNPSGYVTAAQAAAAAPVQSVATRTGAITLTHNDITDWVTTLAPYAPLVSPAMTGIPTVPTATAATNTTQAASTAFVKSLGYLTANQTVTLSGDVTGSGATAIAATLAAVNVNVGTFQGITVNAKGLVTAAANQNYLTANQPITHTGDVTGSGTTTIANTVVALQGRSVAAAAPTANQVLQWSGTVWTPATLAAGGTVTSVVAGSGLTGGTITTTGTIALATALPAGTTAVTQAAGNGSTAVATTAYVDAASATVASGNVGRSFVQNGLFNVQQRGAGPFTAYGAYTLDRWRISGGTDTISITAAAISDVIRAQIGDEAAGFALSNTFTGSSTAAAYNAIYQPIENVRRLSGKTITVSFWAAASTAGMRLGVTWQQTPGTGGTPGAGHAATTGASVTLTGSYTRYSVIFTLPSMSGITLGTNGDSQTQLFFIYSSGSSNAAWAGNPGVQSGTIGLWGIQLEIGSVATPLEKLDLRMDLANCQRFYCVTSCLSGGSGTLSGVATNATAYFPVSMRAFPTTTIITNSSSLMGAISMGPPGGGTTNATQVWGTPTANNGLIQIIIGASADL